MSTEPAAKGPRRTVRIGKYEVLSHIATGGMGAVYRARDTELGREVALKVLPPDLASNPGLLERFRREARSAAKLCHENIVTLFEFGEVGGTNFLALEYVDGIDLHDYINRKTKLDPEEAREILLQAARALEHAHQQGIVHRDIKPSNFLLTRKENGRVLVKMTDMGLAREANDDEHRVTRSGTTVGTIDYISPEQARDSRAADIRSDIYSLGCTFYHMLGGRPPFPEGSLTERLLKHIGEEPEDIVELNPSVPEDLRAILRRMLEKKPEDRYQTPDELIAEITGQQPTLRSTDTLDMLSALAEAEKPRRKAPKRSTDVAAETEVIEEASDSSLRRRSPVSSGSRRPSTKTARVRRRGKSRRNKDEDGEEELFLGMPIETAKKIGILAGVALLLGIIAAIVLRTGSRPLSTEREDNDKPRLTEGIAPPPDRPTVPDKPRDPVVPAGPPQLYPAVAAIDPGQMRKQIEGPWGRDAAQAEPAPLSISRMALLGGTNSSAPSLATAYASAPADQSTVLLEINDNGPLFQSPLAVTGRNIIVRAGKGYRPLLVWDLGATKPDPAAKITTFLDVTQGRLTLENIDVAVRCSNGTGAAALFRVAGGDFLARDCTFSVSGKQQGGVALVQLDPGSAPRPAGGELAPRCRLNRCYARGTSLVSLDVQAPAAEVLLDGCLLVGGELPLLHVTARQDVVTTLRVVRSTLVARETCLRVRSAAGQNKPAFHGIGWDSLLARTSSGVGGALVDLELGADAEALQWQAANCLYAGWMNLLQGSKPIPASDASGWLTRWGRKDGDKAVADTWPYGEPQDPAELLPAVFTPEGAPVTYAASSGKGALGCDTLALPPVRDNWLSLTFERFIGSGSVTDFLSAGAPNEVPVGDASLFHGGRVDLSKTDLGDYLQIIQKTQKLGPRVVLRLTGPPGEWKTSPLHIKGSSLLLCFDPPDSKGQRLLLTPRDNFGGSPEALISVEDGTLDIVGGGIRCPDFKSALVPPFLLLVRGGNLRIHGCHLQGPLTQPPSSYTGLIHLEGSGKTEGDKANVCALSEAVLVSGKGGIEVAGAGARLGMQQCTIVCAEDAIHLQPAGSALARLNLQVSLEHTTIAARRAVLLLDDAPGVTMACTPAVLQSRRCAFLDPFIDKAGMSHRAGLLLAAGDAVARGLLVWQSEGDVYDKRLDFHLAPASGPMPEKAQLHTIWAQLWGPLGDARTTWDAWQQNKLDLGGLQLEHLALTSPARFGTPTPGADLALLGIVKKPAKMP
jgi:serine/threonine protein kinase